MNSEVNYIFYGWLDFVSLPYKQRMYVQNVQLIVDYLFNNKNNTELSIVEEQKLPPKLYVNHRLP